MKQKEPTQGLNRLYQIIFLLLQIVILFFSFRDYEHVVEGVSYFSGGSIMMASLFTFINCFLFLLLTKKYPDKYFRLEIFNYSFFSVFTIAAISKGHIDYPGIVSIIFLIFGLLASFLSIPKVGDSLPKINN